MVSPSLLLAVVFVPILGACLLPVTGRLSAKFRNALAFLGVLVPFVALLSLLPDALSGTPVSLTIPLPLGLSFGLMADGLAVFMALISAFLGLIIVLYSYGYIAHSPHQGEYYFFVVLFIGAMMGITLTTNLIFLYTFWEISAICCWRLIGFFREKEYVRRANKAFLITGAGALIMLGGFIAIYQQYGTFDLTVLKRKPISDLAVILILFGILSKSATLPLHSWLADGGVAPTPATALLHAAVLVKIGVYVFTRLFVVNFEISQVFHVIVPVIAAVSAMLSAGAAIREDDIKRIIAYSTVSQLGFIMLGLSVGGELSLAGGLLYILMHAVSKAGLFLCAGIIEHACHTKDIRRMGGLFKQMPVTAVSFLLCAFSVMGLPPFGGFFSKYMVIAGTVEAGQPIIAIVFIISAVMTLIYLMRAFMLVFLGEPRETYPDAHDATPTMVASVSLLAVLSLVSGLLVATPADYVEKIVTQMAVILK
ncbi:MAG: NADH-quinone oxidoreductase subunit L [Clostridiales bacterium]|nr:NADH-quinone oxidoreductase subunit L [Clostridiales bacterium]